MNNGTYKQINQ